MRGRVRAGESKGLDRKWAKGRVGKSGRVPHMRMRMHMHMHTLTHLPS